MPGIHPSAGSPLHPGKRTLFSLFQPARCAEHFVNLSMGVPLIRPWLCYFLLFQTTAIAVVVHNFPPTPPTHARYFAQPQRWASLELCGDPLDGLAPNWPCIWLYKSPGEIDIVTMERINLFWRGRGLHAQTVDLDGSIYFQWCFWD